MHIQLCTGVYTNGQEPLLSRTMGRDLWDPTATTEAETHIGVRELRRDLGTYVRRAAGGEAVVVTIGGQPMARLAPLSAGADWNLDDLIAAGLVDPASRTDRPPPPAPGQLAEGLSTNRSIEELRGR